MTGLRGAHVVVTGSSGFIGSRLAGLLGDAGVSVVGIDRRPPGPDAPPTIVDALDHPRPETRDALHEAAVVFHLAGRPGVVGHGGTIERDRWRDNVLATEQVLAVLRASTVLVAASSSSVYGGAAFLGGRPRPSRESDRVRPRGGYARSKVELERRCFRRAGAGGRVTVVRPFTVAGEGQRPDMAVARWLRCVEAGRPVVVRGSAQRRRDVTDVDDVVRALVDLAHADPGGVVNVGTGRACTLAELVEAVELVVGRRARVRHRRAEVGEVVATRADTTRLVELVGWEPRTDLVELVARQWAAAGSGLAGVPAEVLKSA